LVPLFPAPRRAAVVLYPVLMALLVLGCERPGPAVIGYAFPYSAAAVARLAREAIAELPGQPAVRIAEDTVAGGDRADLAVARARRMVEVPGLVGVVGHPDSRGALAAAPVYNDAGVVQITPLATSRWLDDAGPWTFTLAPDDSVEGAFIGRFVDERLGAREVALLYIGDEYGEGLRDGIAAELEGRGVRISREFLYDAESDLETLVRASLQPRVPDVVIVAGLQGSTAEIARHMMRYAPGIPVVAGDGALRLPGLAAEAGPATGDLYLVSLWVADTTDARYREFESRFRQLTGETPNPTDVLTYDALMLLVTAAVESGGDPAAVRRWLVGLGRSRPPYQGVTGPITVDGSNRPLTMVRLVDGQPVPVPFP
jgi:branched-chain amino acid transport system substrate-binding protein